MQIMQFNNPVSQPNMMGLVPIKNYKGLVLKLTPADKKKIAELQAKRAGYEIELYKISVERRKKNYSFALDDYYDNKVLHIQGFIRDIEQMIKDIKTNRLNKQKAKQAKLDTTI